jgi:drug/metabolite transporter (DMT)-like permease
MCGAALFLASLAQQIGIAYTTPGVSAFLTTNYMLLIPVFGIFVGRVARPVVWIWVVCAIIGSYFICISADSEGVSLGRGEAWTLLCAALFAVQVLCVDRFAPGTDVVAFSCVQQLAGALFGLPFIFMASERAYYTSEHLTAAIWPLLYVGIL